MLALEFPPISHLINWPEIALKGTAFAINKVTILMLAAAVIVVVFYVVAGRKRELVPKGAQNVAEISVDFIQDGIILQGGIGPEGMGWTVYLLSVFSFIFTLNLIGLLPVVQMPVNARMAVPALLGIQVWFIFNFIGIKHQGFFGYFKGIMFPPGVPKPIYVILTPIEFISTILVRPFSLAVRLFANLLAGHLILVSFAVITNAMFLSGFVGALGAVGPGAMLLAMTVFEILVAFLQAYIFTILTAVYIGGAMHPEH